MYNLINIQSSIPSFFCIVAIRGSDRGYVFLNSWKHDNKNSYNGLNFENNEGNQTKVWYGNKTDLSYRPVRATIKILIK